MNILPILAAQPRCQHFIHNELLRQHWVVNRRDAALEFIAWLATLAIRQPGH